MTYFKKIIENYFVWKVDTIVWNSRFLQGHLKNLYKRDIKILYPIVDSIYFEENNIVNWLKKWWDNKRKIFTAWRWDDWKWLKDIFQIYEVLKDKYNFQIEIAGIWTQQEYFENLYKWDKDIIFLWKLEGKKIKEKFLESDIFLFPSKIDSFGLVIIESLLSNTPVISYELWEAEFLIKNWENWYLVKDIDEYIKILIKIFKDEDLLIKLQETSRKSVVSNYSMKNFEEQLVKIIFEK